MILSTALACMAFNVYQEARNQSIPGQYAVALVTLNRAGHDEGKVCQEVFRPYQFSWTNDAGVVKTKAGWDVPQRLSPKEEHAWWVANRVALMTLTGRMSDITAGSTYYHTTAVAPSWRLAMKATIKIGAHKFYARAA